MISGKKRPLSNELENDVPVKRKSSTLKDKNHPKNSAKLPEDKSVKLNKEKKNPVANANGKGRLAIRSKPSIKNGDSKQDGKPSAPTEKPDWKKLKKEKKDLKLKRKQSKDSYEISIEAKKIYEKLKCRNTENKKELVEKLYKMVAVGDLLKKVVMAHDTGRIIQCMLKFAAPALREKLSERLLQQSVEMSTSKYAHFCVLRMFKYGSPAIKSKLVDSFLGHVVKLACHAISSKILDYAYLTIASTKQKTYMRQEFYGDLYKHSKDENVKVLSDAYKDTSDMKPSILGSVKSNLDRVANKKLVDNSLVHAVMLEYLEECEESKIEETVASFATLTPLMLSTKDGTQAAILCFYKSSAKHRRAIIKSIKEHLVKICTHEHGHVFIIAILNSLDDTKATKKAIYDNIHPDIQTLMLNQWGRRVIEWLIAPADTNYFHPAFIARIDSGLQYGKKDKDLRRKEIFQQIEEPIADNIAQQPEFWLSDRHIAVVTADILNKLEGENFAKAAKAISVIICDPSWSITVQEEGTHNQKSGKSQDIEKIIAAAKESKKQIQKSKDNEGENGKELCVAATNTTPGIEDPGLHLALKRIIKNDQYRRKSDSETFGSILLQHMHIETLKHWLAINRACFILLNVIENNNENIIETFTELLKPVKEKLQEQASNGAQLLLKKLTF